MWRLQSAASLSRLGRKLASSQLCKSQGCSANLVRNYWNKDWAADPKVPETEAEKAAAAKKYGLLPQDYEPYVDEKGLTQVGDYPKLPDKGVDSRSPWEDWDMPSLRRNYGDPVHLNADIYGEDRYQPDAKYFVPIPKMFLILGSIVASFFFLAWFLEDYKTTQLVAEKQLPYEYLRTGGEKPKHYTFKRPSED